MLLTLQFVRLPAPYVLSIPRRELAEEESRVQITQLEDTYSLTVLKYWLEFMFQEEQSFVCCVMKLSGRTGKVLAWQDFVFKVHCMMRHCELINAYSYFWFSVSFKYRIELFPPSELHHRIFNISKANLETVMFSFAL